MYDPANYKTLLNIFRHFLILGCTSFGGPAAHIGYFRKRFVEELNWLDERSYGNLVALSQFLPGPGSSQVGFALGMKQGGIAGGIAAFLGFTLPSFFLLLLLAISAAKLETFTTIHGIVHALKLLAVIVIADALLGMWDNFCSQRKTQGLALFTASCLLLLPNLWIQMLLLVAAALFGSFFLSPCRQQQRDYPLNRRVHPALYIFILLFFGLPLLTGFHPLLELVADFYYSGSLVFGGGHVVLPLLQQTLSDQLSQGELLMGYSAAQAVPGPMFTIATFLGAKLAPEMAFTGAVIATVCIFAPGFLLLIGIKNRWDQLAANARFAGGINGINAAVVGLLLATLCSPVFISSVQQASDFIWLIGGYFLLRTLQLPIVWLVMLFALSGAILL